MFRKKDIPHSTSPYTITSDQRTYTENHSTHTPSTAGRTDPSCQASDHDSTKSTLQRRNESTQLFPVSQLIHSDPNPLSHLPSPLSNIPSHTPHPNPSSQQSRRGTLTNNKPNNTSRIPYLKITLLPPAPRHALHRRTGNNQTSRRENEDER